MKKDPKKPDKKKKTAKKKTGKNFPERPENNFTQFAQDRMVKK